MEQEIITRKGTYKKIKHGNTKTCVKFLIKRTKTKKNPYKR